MKKVLVTVSIFFCTMTFSQVPSYVPSNGLIGWWPFNGNANDESGNGNNGTVNGATITQDRNGNANSAYSFDGLDDFIQTSCTPVLGSNARSFSFWFKSSVLLNSNVFFYGSPNPMYGSFRLGISEPFGNCEGVSFNVSDGQFTKSQICNDNIWHQVVFVMNDGYGLLDVSLYFDGQILLSNNCSNYGGNTPINTLQEFPLVIGMDLYYNTFFNGLIDDIGIWNRALTACEISNLYSGQLPNSTQNEAAIDTYTWPVNGQTYTQSGTYTTIIPNAAGCDSTITLNLTMNYAGIQENKTSHFSIYPNPTTDVLLIEGNWIENTLFELIDIEGRVVLTGLLSDNNHSLDLTSIEAGNYILSIEEQKIRVMKN